MNRKAIEALLGEAFPEMNPQRYEKEINCWRLPLMSAGVAHARLVVEDRWVSLDAEAPNKCTPLEALCSQYAWPGNVKHIEAGKKFTLRVEVPLLTGTAPGCAWTLQQLRASKEGLKIALDPAVGVANAGPEGRKPTDPESIALSCATAGWNAIVASDNTVRIDMEIRGAHRQVVLEPSPLGMRVSVTLIAGLGNRASESCRTALGVFLMRTSTALRWARAFARCDAEMLDSVGFECWIAAPSDERALCSAVDVLITSCELFGRETEVLLESPDIAAHYLSASERNPTTKSQSRSGAAAVARVVAPNRAAHAAAA